MYISALPSLWRSQDFPKGVKVLMIRNFGKLLQAKKVVTYYFALISESHKYMSSYSYIRNKIYAINFLCRTSKERFNPLNSPLATLKTLSLVTLFKYIDVKLIESYGKDRNFAVMGKS